MVATRKRLVILGSAVGALAVARLAHQLGLETIVFDRTRGIACASRKARTEIANGDDSEVLARLRSLASQAAPTYVIACSDGWLRFLQMHRTMLADTYHGVLHPDNAILDICLKKLLLADWCGAHGFPAPRATDGSSQLHLDSLRAPWILRPNETQHDNPSTALPKSVEVRDEVGLTSWLEKFAQTSVPAVVSESLLNRRLVQYSVPFVRTPTQFQSYVAEKCRPTATRCRIGTYLEPRDNPEIEALARRVIETLAFQGIGEVEILHDADTGESFVIEVNPRPWEQFSHSMVLGFNFLGVALGDSNCPCPATPLPNLAWADITHDLFEVFSRREGMLVRGELTFGTYLRTLPRIRAFATFQCSDPWPLMLDIARMLQEKWRRLFR